MDADFTAGSGDSRSARQPGYRLTHPDSPSPGTSPNPVLTGIDTGGYNGLNRNGQDTPAAQWSSAPVTLHATPEPEGLPRRLAPDLPQRSADPEAVAARLSADGDPFAARITTDRDPFTAPAAAEYADPNASLYARTRPNNGAFTDGGSYTATPLESEIPAVRPVNGSPFGGRIDEDMYGASPAVEAPATGRRYAPDPEPAPARLESLEAVAASLRESVQETPRPAERQPIPSRRRAAPEPEPEPIVAEPIPVVAESIPLVTESPAPSPAASRAAEFRTGDASIDLHHIMRLLTASHDLEVAAQAAESGAGTVSDLAAAAHRTRSAAVEIVAAWYGGADHMRNFGEVLLQAATESRAG
ncbi:hypothetical protein ACFXHA_23640 [Nocardia sp. NPDC059240]|uniref:hypothetical protein n=1 Tax=Nocardia sp. NPDC059240 TaxID=3346786 RepID=UPI0036A5AFAC